MFRFLCPICNEFQTGINANVNLVRCFRCERNFNAIDFVMENQGCGVTESVLFLKQIGDEYMAAVQEMMNQVQQAQKDHGQKRFHKTTGKKILQRSISKNRHYPRSITPRNKQIKIAHLQHGYTLKEIADELGLH